MFALVGRVLGELRCIAAHLGCTAQIALDQTQRVLDALCEVHAWHVPKQVAILRIDGARA
jgi:hypothetical protein